MKMHGLAVALLSASAAAQATHNGHIWIEGPSEALAADTTYTLEVWGRWESPEYVQGESMMAGFGIGIENTRGSASVDRVENIVIDDWAAPFGTIGPIEGTDITRVSGGQVAFVFNMGYYEIGHPLRLFTFDMHTGATVDGSVAFAPAWPTPNGGLSFYPYYTNGASITAPNHPDSALHLHGWTSVPGPMSVVPFALAAFARRRRLA